MKYVIAIDQSTQGTKAMLFDGDGNIVCCRTKAHRQLVDDNGYVSHDPEEIYTNVIDTVAGIVSASGINSHDIVAAGITNQRETSVLFDSTGSLAPAVVWQCTRSKDIIKLLVSKADIVYKTTGLPLSPYFPASKMRWLLDHIKPRGDYMFGTIDTYLLYRLTGNYVTDRSNASRTQLMNIESLEWDDTMLSVFGLSGVKLPRILPSNGEFGVTDFDGVLDKKIPIAAVMGDSHAAFYAHGCENKGDVKATYGTGTSVMMNAGGLVQPCNGLSVSVAWSTDDRTDYVLEGNINYSTAVVGWLKTLGVIDNPTDTSNMAKSANMSDTTVFVPAFGGLSAPYQKQDARAAISGMSRLTGRNEIVKAALDSIAFQVNDIISVMSDCLKSTPITLRVDGGGTANSYLMQRQSDITSLEVTVPNCSECSAFGVAKLAAEKFDLRLSLESGVSYCPKLLNSERKRDIERWREALLKL